MRTKTNLLPLVIFVIGLGYAFHGLTQNQTSLPAAPAIVSKVPSTANDRQLAAAFAQHQRGIAVQGTGEVVKILSDDTTGTRHQRFILELASGQTLIVAHNIDLAPRIPALAVGDRVEFKGQYEWNPKGGTIHWTHRDPEGRHPAGWLKHNGYIYQ